MKLHNKKLFLSLTLGVSFCFTGAFGSGEPTLLFENGELRSSARSFDASTNLPREKTKRIIYYNDGKESCVDSCYFDEVSYGNLQKNGLDEKGLPYDLRVIDEHTIQFDANFIIPYVSVYLGKNTISEENGRNAEKLKKVYFFNETACIYSNEQTEQKIQEKKESLTKKHAHLYGLSSEKKGHSYCYTLKTEGAFLNAEKLERVGNATEISQINAFFLLDLNSRKCAQRVSFSQAILSRRPSVYIKNSTCEKMSGGIA